MERYRVYGRLALLDAEIDGYLEIQDGRIADIQFHDPPVDGTPVLYSPDAIWPGLIDLHVHGAGGADVMDGTPEALNAMSRELAKHGVTRFLATTVTESEDALTRALRNVATSGGGVAGARVAGVHLEGPFISTRRMGAQNPRYVIDASLEVFDRLQSAAQGQIRIVTLAPETSGADAFMRAARMRSNGADVIWSVGHSDGTFSDVQRARAAGVTHVTHCFNAMRGFHHREPGVIGAALYFDDLTTELIADGIHTHEKAAALLVKIKEDHTVLVSDGIRAVGMPPGEYDLGGQTIHVDGTRATLADGTLAGSVLTLEQAVANIGKFADLPLYRAVRMASFHPARELQSNGVCGRLAVGCRADFALVDSSLRVTATYVDGECVFTAES